jgi:D-galactose 1-dehydrogenase
LFERGEAVDALALCTPPQLRFALADMGIAHGLHILLEKPPGVTPSEVAALERRSREAGTTLFAAWHSRFAAGVEPARAWLAGRAIRNVRIVWREDARVWHPGQAWIWEPGGFGVFDPGINALSILTRILPRPFQLVDALLSVPKNREAPIAAAVTLRDDRGIGVTIDLDWRQSGPQSWDIMVATDAGGLRLSMGGAVLSVPDGTTIRGEDREYPGLYARFGDLIRAGASEVDSEPLRLVAEAFLRGRLETVADFYD